MEAQPRRGPVQRVFIGRQPILDASGELYGYELLCRDEQGNLAIIGNGDRESTLLLLDAILTIGLERLTKSHRAFINVTETLLLEHLIDSLPPKNIVLEVLETVAPTPELVRRLGVLRSRKFLIALDDFVPGPEHEVLVEHADIIKFDVRQTPIEDLARHAAALKTPSRKLLAEKVETRAEFEQLKALGFDLFQGYYFARPDLYEARALRPNRVAVLQLLGRVNDPDVTITELAGLIRGDVGLSVALLRFSNAAGTGLSAPVDSIDRAIVALGLYTIQNWLGLLALARMGSGPSELITTVLVRARTCELLSKAMQRDNPAGYFTVGLFSALDVMMESPMNQLIEQLPLAPELKSALGVGAGDHGAALKAVIALEGGDIAGASYGRLTSEVIGACYVQAIEWADQFLGATAHL